jgi:hypothetical protein
VFILCMPIWIHLLCIQTLFVYVNECGVYASVSVVYGERLFWFFCYCLCFVTDLQRLLYVYNRKWIKFVLHRNLLKMQCSTFLIRNLNGRYLLNIKTLSFYFCNYLGTKAKIVTKIGIIFLMRWNLLSKIQVLTFLCIRDTLRMTNFKFLNIFSGFWTPKIVTKSAIRCILGWNLLKKLKV